MAKNKTHFTDKANMTHSKYGLVEVYPAGQLRTQDDPFYTINIIDAPFDTLDDARMFLLEPVFSNPKPDVTKPFKDLTPEIIERRKWKINPFLIKKVEGDEFTNRRKLRLTWARLLKLIGAPDG